MNSGMTFGANTQVLRPREGGTVTLKGITRHGKNRINQHGDTWRVKEIRGMKMLLESQFKTEGPRDNKGFDWRWVEMHNDPNFDWS